jgi:ABC-type Mn2+/Zn2+ transport system ATPase subunit
VSTPPGDLVLAGVRKRFSRGGRWVLDGIDLTAGPGQLTLITGGNGSGKSTLLRIMAGASRAGRGDVQRPPGAAAYVPERLPGRLRLTPRQYLAHMGRIRGLGPAQVAARSDELLTRLALAPGPDVPIGTLSRGNAQKAALAQALLAPVRLLVLDEPYGGLDDRALAAAVVLVDEAAAGGAVVVLAAPGPEVAAAHRPRTWFQLSGGRLLARAAAPAPESRVMCVTLTAAVPQLSASDLAALPGVLSVRPDASGRGLEVRTSAADAFLRCALGAGWSLERAQPEAAPGEAGERG